MLLLRTQKITEEKHLVVVIDYRPDLLTEEQKEGGYLVEDVPNPDIIVGKVSELYYNPKTKEIWYEYFDRPLTVEEIANQKLAEQQSQIDELTLLLGDVLIGGAM